MFENEISLDMLWDGPPEIRRRGEDHALRSNIARTLLETCGRVRRCAELLARDGTMPDLAPTPSELQLTLDLASCARFPKPVQLELLVWVETVSEMFGAGRDCAAEVLAVTKNLGDTLLQHLAPAPADLERWAAPIR